MKQLCSYKQQVTNFLFGDDVAKSVKEITDTNKAISTFAPYQYRGYGGKAPRVWVIYLDRGRGGYGQSYGRGYSRGGSFWYSQPRYPNQYSGYLTQRGKSAPKRKPGRGNQY